MEQITVRVSKSTFEFLKSLVEASEENVVGSGNALFRAARRVDPEQLAYVVKEIKQIRPHNILID